MPRKKGVYKWSTIDRVLSTFITFGGNIAMARLLSPDDFGLLAMVGIFTAIAQNLSSCGMSDGLVRKPVPTRADYSTVFTFNLAAGVFFSLLFLVLAKPLASMFRQPDLESIVLAISFCFVFQCMSFVQETRLRKHLEMRQIAIVHLSASATAVGLGIVLAATGFGYWGLVSCRVFVGFFLFLYYIIATRWLPKIGINRQSFKEMFGYGVNLMWAYLFNQIGRNINASVLGRISPAQSGIFSQGQKMEEVPFTVTESIFNWPFFAVLSNEHDPEQKKNLSHDMLRGLSMLVVTIGTLLMLLGDPGFHLVFGEKWDASIPVFRILLIYGMAFTLKGFFHTIMKAHGKTPQIRNIALFEVVFQVALLILFYRRGILWIAATQSIASVVILFFLSFYYCRLTGITFFGMIKIAFSLLPVPLAAFTLTAVGYWMWNSAVGSLLSCLLTIGTYCACAIALWEIFPNPFYKKYRTTILARFRTRSVIRQTAQHPESDDFLGD